MYHDLTAGIVRLKRGREKPVLEHHPWIFSGAIAVVEGDPKPGQLVDIVTSDDAWLALGYFNSHSQIRVRILTWLADEEITPEFWTKRLLDAITLRTQIVNQEQTNAYRLVNAESDRLPGLVVDRYADVLVMQCLTAGIDLRKLMLARSLMDLTQARAVVERSDVDVRRHENLQQESGTLSGDFEREPFMIRENGLSFEVDTWTGQKTGLYLDQRENRRIVTHPSLVQGGRILNVFSYTGGFGVYAAVCGAASVINVDSSRSSLEAAERNVALNAGSRLDDEFILGNAFEVLREFRGAGEQYDMVILDPPKFAHKQRDVSSAMRGYKDLNLMALQMLRPNGYLATYSCSGLVSQDAFQQAIVSASVDAGRPVQFLRRLQQAPDHPVLSSFPQGAYLKGFLCRAF